MGRPNGFEKANRIADRIIADIERNRATEVSARDLEGAGVILAWAGVLQSGEYQRPGTGKRVYTPKKEG